MKTENQFLEDTFSVSELKSLVDEMLDSLINQYKLIHLKKWIHDQSETLPTEKINRLNQLKAQLEELEKKNPNQQLNIELSIKLEGEKHLKKVQYA